MLYVGCFRQELLACQRRVRNERLPPPSCPQQHSHEDEESGHARSVTAFPMAVPETEVRYCKILLQVVAWGAVMGKGLTVGDGSTSSAAERQERGHEISIYVLRFVSGSNRVDGLGPT